MKIMPFMAALVLGSTPGLATPRMLGTAELGLVTAGAGSIATKVTPPYLTTPKGSTKPNVAQGAKCQCGKGATVKLGKK